MDLAEFLLARIAEDEAAARDAMGGPWHSCARSPVEVHQYENGRHFCEHWRATAMTMNECEHIARFNPARVLAECEAKRAIVAARQTIDAHVRQIALTDHEEARDARNTRAGLDVALKALALPYADAPDYDESWRP